MLQQSFSVYFRSKEKKKGRGYYITSRPGIKWFVVTWYKHKLFMNFNRLNRAS